MKKRPKYITNFIELGNALLRDRKEKDYNCDLSIFMENYLMKQGDYYEGFNFYKEGNNGNLELAGSTLKENYDCIQIV